MPLVEGFLLCLYGMTIDDWLIILQHHLYYPSEIMVLRDDFAVFHRSREIVLDGTRYLGLPCAVTDKDDH